MTIRPSQSLGMKLPDATASSTLCTSTLETAFTSSFHAGTLTAILGHLDNGAERSTHPALIRTVHNCRVAGHRSACRLIELLCTGCHKCRNKKLASDRTNCGKGQYYPLDSNGGGHRILLVFPTMAEATWEPTLRQIQLQAGIALDITTNTQRGRLCHQRRVIIRKMRRPEDATKRLPWSRPLFSHLCLGDSPCQ